MEIITVAEKEEKSEMVETGSPSVPKLNIVTERIDDLPLLIAQMERIGLPGLLDQSFPTHTNWQGLSLGWVTSFWCAHILSQADHCLNHVQPWAEKRLQLLHECCTHPVVALDFTDDRLALVLNQLSDDSRWYAFEGSLSQRVMRVYDLNPEAIRLDSSTSYGYWGVSPEGLFQFGHSKDHRPDLPQLKIMLSTLDPSGFPLVTTVVSGEKADDPLYIPAVERVREGLQQRGLLYVGDAKMAAIETRAFIVKGEDFYLCPLPKKQVSNEQLESYLEPVWAGTQDLTKVYATDEDGKVLLDDDENPVQMAEGFELSEELSATHAGEKLDWSERRLVVRSLAQAHNAETKLRKQFNKGLAAILALNERKRGKKRYRAA